MAVIYIMNTASLDINPELVNKMSPKRIERINKAKSMIVKQESLGAGLMLNNILEDNYFLDLDRIEYIYNEQGKPYIKDSELYFSISHSKGISIVCVDSNEIGVDIEEILPHDKKVALRIMSDEEYNYYLSLDNNKKEEYFYQIWCAKEAYIKKIGSTIFSNLKDINLDCDVVTRTYIINNRKFMIASCGLDAFRIIERYVPREYQIKK